MVNIPMLDEELITLFGKELWYAKGSFRMSR